MSRSMNVEKGRISPSESPAGCALARKFTFTLADIEKSNRQSKSAALKSNKKKEMPVLNRYIPLSSSSKQMKTTSIRVFLEACNENNIPVYSSHVLLFKTFILKGRFMMTDEERYQSEVIAFREGTSAGVERTDKATAKKVLAGKKAQKLKALVSEKSSTKVHDEDEDEVTTNEVSAASTLAQFGCWDDEDEGQDLTMRTLAPACIGCWDDEDMTNVL